MLDQAQGQGGGGGLHQQQLPLVRARQCAGTIGQVRSRQCASTVRQASGRGPRGVHGQQEAGGLVGRCQTAFCSTALQRCSELYMVNTGPFFFTLQN